MDYLTEPKIWWNFGFGLGLVGNKPPGERVTDSDRMLIAGYAGYNLEGAVGVQQTLSKGLSESCGQLQELT